jgi:branched-chain amino acid transport system substrate-binding protein
MVVQHQLVRGPGWPYSIFYRTPARAAMHARAAKNAGISAAGDQSAPAPGRALPVSRVLSPGAGRADILTDRIAHGPAKRACAGLVHPEIQPEIQAEQGGVMLRKLIVAASVAAATGAAGAQVKVGVILGFTGPIESITPGMAASAELAFKEASDSGLLLGGQKIVPVRADSTCTDAAAASAAASRLVTAERVAAIMGADCSGVTTAIVNNVAVPNGVVMVSPSATSPALTTIKDNGFFFRTAPSDARQGEVLAGIVFGRGIRSVAVTHTNNDYGKGLTESFRAAYTKLGGKVAIVTPHDDGKADYTAEVGALSASGVDALAVFGYVDQGGRGILRAAIDAGAFKRFIVGDGMIGDSLIAALGKDVEGLFGTKPGSDSPGAAQFGKLAKAAGIDPSGPYRSESYDAAALIVLAMQAAKSTDRAAIQKAMMDVANGPGEKILPGELAKGLKILADGGKIDYEGASDVRFTEVGEASGSYKELEIKGGKFVTVKVH